MKVFLAGPIDYWWNENWETPAHIAYMEWRTYIHKRLVEAGHVVYSPHNAIKGAWDEAMQAINDTAIHVCDVLIYLTPYGIPAHGTDDEVVVARLLGKQVYHAPPTNHWQIDHLIVPLDDPYGDVHRKSYTKE